MVQQANPAEYAYTIASQQLQLKEMQNPDEYRKKVEAEIRAKVEAEYADKERKRTVPPTLADARGAAGGTRTPEWQGPAPLNEVLGIK